MLSHLSRLVAKSQYVKSRRRKGYIMKINISTKNYDLNDNTEERLNRKLKKLEKYFDKDTSVNAIISSFRGMPKLEVTIRAKQATFRAESVNKNIYDNIDIVVDKLSSQMSKFKGKLEARYKENKSLRFELIPDPDEHAEDDMLIERRKAVRLEPMNAEEAMLQMEMLGHDFFVFLDMDTNAVSVIYRRKDNAYGLIETDH